MVNIDKYIKKYLKEELEKENKNDKYICHNCEHIWRTKNKDVGSYKCPKCNSKDVSVLIDKLHVYHCGKCLIILTEDNFGGLCRKLICGKHFCKKDIYTCKKCRKLFCENHIHHHMCFG